jgi:hypothetical protein
VHCGKCPLSTAKETVSPVGALLKVSNLKRFLKSVLGWRVVKDTCFKQLRRVFYKVVRCGKCILSAANRGLQRGTLRKVKIINR